MACIREAAANGRLGIVSCDEEGCLFRCYATERGTWTTDETPETDCLLQLRLRAGDPEDTVEGLTHAHHINEGPIEPYEPERLHGVGWAGDTELKFDFPDSPAFRREGKYPWGNGPLEGEPGPRVIENVDLRRANISLDKEPGHYGGELREAETSPSGRPVRVLESGIYDFGIVAHDNGKTEHERVRKNWEQLMGVPAESGGDEGEPQLDRKGNWTMSGEDEYGREPRTIYKNAKIERSDVFGELAKDRVEGDLWFHMCSWHGNKVLKFTTQYRHWPYCLTECPKIEIRDESGTDRGDVSEQGDAPDDTPRDDKGRIDYIRVLTERVPGLVADEIERREAERIKRSLEEALERFKQPSHFITPPEARARLTEGTASANDITKSLGIPNNGGGYEGPPNSGITYRDEPRRSGWFKRLFGRK